MVTVALCVLFGVTVFTGDGPPLRQSGKYTVYGYGTLSCGSWLQRRKDKTSVAIEGWLLGWVSAAGYYGENLRQTDADGIAGWIDNYCTSHPLEHIADATKALVIELRQK